IADASAALAASISLGLQGDGELRYLLWSALFVPVWIVLAKLNGLYDRDQRSLRHLTVDELPHILVWAILGTIALTLLLRLTPSATSRLGPSCVPCWSRAARHSCFGPARASSGGG